MTRSVLVPLFLLGTFTVRGAGEPGITKGADEFEFVYRVKLPESPEWLVSGYRYTTLLEIPPVNSPQSAVKMAIANKSWS